MLINSWQIIQFLIVLVFAGIELIFFIVACMVLLGFWFVMKTVFDNAVIF